MPNVFVYGTLMYPEFIEELAGRRYEMKEATLHGYRRYRVKEKIYPGVIPGEGRVEGKLLLDVDPGSIQLFDMYEGEEYKRIEVEVISEGQTYKAYMYLFKQPEHLEGEWSPEAIDRQLVLDFIGKIRERWEA